MKPGDLRRFNDNYSTRAYDKPGYTHIAGLTFMVIAIDEESNKSWVSFLLNGAIMEGWSYNFVLDNSEHLDETR